MNKSGNLEEQLPDGIKALENQGGGHMFNAKKGMIGIMQHADGSLLKPISPDAAEQSEDGEEKFYEKISRAEDAVDAELLRLIPKYYGTQTLQVGDRDVLCMKMENFTLGYKRACVLDIKVGRVTSTPNAPRLKRDHEASKYLGTRNAVGFSVPGMTVYDVTGDAPVQHGKEYGKQLTGDTVCDAFRVFLNADCGAVVRPICEALLSQLEDIDGWFSRQRKYRFFASSILLTYDAVALRPPTGEQMNSSTIASGVAKAEILSSANPVARMIDFAHVWTSEEEPDENYREGLRNIIRLVKLVMDSL